MQCPKVYTTLDVRHWNVSESKELVEARPVIGDRSRFYFWRPSRPKVPLLNIGQRFRLAFLVFIGRYDALNWECVPQHTASDLKKAA